MPISNIFDEESSACYRAQIGNFFDTYDDAYDFIQTRCGIEAALYNANLKRFIFTKHDQALAEENDGSNVGPIDSASDHMGNESTQTESLVKIETSLNLNDPGLFELSNDTNQIEENAGALEESHDLISFSSVDSSNIDNENSSVAALDNVDPIQNAINFPINIKYPASPTQNDSDMICPLPIKKEEKIGFLHLPDEILDISGEEFDALREDLAYDTDSEDSFVGLQKEFDNLVSTGVNLPAPIKEEPNVDIAQNVKVSNDAKNRNNNLANVFNDQAEERIRTEYPNSQFDNNFDPVLGSMAKLVNELKNRWVLKYGIEVKNTTYSLLEFYNSLSEVNPKFYDEKFARIMFTSFIGTGKIANSFEYDPKHNIVLFMKELFNVRVGDDQERAVWFDCFIKKYIEKTKARLGLKKQN